MPDPATPCLYKSQVYVQHWDVKEENLSVIALDRKLVCLWAFGERAYVCTLSRAWFTDGRGDRIIAFMGKPRDHGYLESGRDGEFSISSRSETARALLATTCLSGSDSEAHAARTGKSIV